VQKLSVEAMAPQLASPPTAYNTGGKASCWSAGKAAVTLPESSREAARKGEADAKPAQAAMRTRISSKDASLEASQSQG